MIDTTTLTTVLRRAARRVKGAPEATGRRAPSGATVPMLGLRAGSRERLNAMMQASLTHGHVVRFELPWITAHMITHPDQIEEVLISRHREFDKKTRGYDKLREFLGHGLLTSDGDFWLRQRRIAQPAFHKKRVDGFVGQMAQATDDMLDRWDRELSVTHERDVAGEMMRLTLRIASLTLLSSDTESNGSSIAEPIGRAVTTLVHEANHRINELVTLPDHWPTRRNRERKVAMDTLDGTVLGIIEARRRALGRGEAAAHEDLLQMFLEATDADTGARMNDQQLRDEIMTMFLAGHETTANSLTWALYLLGKSPHVARALRDEARTVLGDRAPTAEDVGKLELSRRVVSEALRLYPPVWIVGRSTVHELELGGYTIPARSLLFVVPYITHRHPDFWRDPEGFDPDRFAPERKGEMLHKHQYFPFIAGPRMCIGAQFAMHESILALSQITRRFRVSLVPGQIIEPEPMITLRPAHGVRVALDRW